MEIDNEDYYDIAEEFLPKFLIEESKIKEHKDYYESADRRDIHKEDFVGVYYNICKSKKINEKNRKIFGDLCIQYYIYWKFQRRCKGYKKFIPIEGV
ncbi:MAG: hypothetical protein ACE5KE_13225 [Methanosarcinales archaeon]